VAQDTISFKVEGADRVLRDFARAGARAQPMARKSVRETSFAVERRIKNEMPIDEGRARASWGHWTPGDLVGSTPEATRADAHWSESDNGLTTTQGSNVPYIVGLNEGHSKQAPAGFIDRAVEAGQRALIQAIAQIVEQLR
jgi:hypothetical protein